MLTAIRPPARTRAPPALLLCLLLTACGAPPPPSVSAPDAISGAWAGVPFGSPPAPRPRVRQAMIGRAIQEWEFFGRQTVILKGEEESIPHVGIWEDDDARRSQRINAYWRTVDKPALDGMDCAMPWSAAFIGWIMQESGVPESQFPRAAAHWVYLARAIESASAPGRWFVPRRVADYSPRPGDLICAPRGPYRPAAVNGYVSAQALEEIGSHCDLVVDTRPRTLDAIGGNVRNSVSRITLELDAQGRLQPVPRRPWFMILENRL